MTKQEEKSAMKSYGEQLNNEIDELVFEMRRSNDSSKKFQMILTIDVHTRDIVENLIRDGIQSADDL
jgi:hypothetical protein